MLTYTKYNIVSRENIILKGDKLMPFFDDLTKKMSEVAKSAAKKSEDLVETTKLKMAINSEEDKIKAAYTEIGKIIYKKYSSGENVDEDVLSSCQQIKSMEDTIVTLSEKITQIKNSSVQAHESHDTHAPEHVQPQLEPHAAPSYIPSTEPSDSQEQVAKPVSPVCSACGTTASPDNKFCPSCGNRL